MDPNRCAPAHGNAALAALLASSIAASATTAHAGQAKATMQVSATIVQSATFGALRQPAGFTVSAAQAATRSIRVREAVHLSLDHGRTWVLEFQKTAPQATRATVRVSGIPLELNDSAQLVLRRGSARQASVAIDYDFELAPHVEPGFHAWPVMLTVTPFL